MNLRNAYLLALLASLGSIGVVSSIEIPPTTGGDCWDSTLAIVANEVGVIFNPDLYQTQRTYIICPTTIDIGYIDVLAAVAGGGFAPIGGDFPLFVINPNFHLKCATPGTCIFRGGQKQIESFTDVSLVALFVQSQNSGLAIPEGYGIDTSGMLIEGMTFTGSNDDLASSDSTIELLSPGMNMQIIDCVFQGNGNLGIAAWAAINIFAAEVLPGGSDHASMIVRNTVFENNRFAYSVISLIPSAWPNGKVLQFTLENCEIKNNNITSTAHTGFVLQRASLLTAMFTDLKVDNTTFSGNTIEEGYAQFVLAESELQATNLNLSPTTIYSDTSVACRDVQKLSLVSDGPNESGSSLINRVFVDEGCQEFGPEPIVREPSDGTDCWGSIFAILQAEISVIFDAALIDTERIYNMCSKTYIIGIIGGNDPDSPLSAGGDYPMVPFLPNVVLKCVTRDCIFSGGEEQIFNLRNNDLLEAFLRLVGGPALPSGFHADSTNFRVEGLTFTGASQFCDVCLAAPVQLVGRGNNMKFIDCIFTSSSENDPPFSAISMLYSSETGIKPGEKYYSSIALENCSIENNEFRFAAIAASFREDMPTAPVAKITLDGSFIKNNFIASTAELIGDRAGLLSTLFTNVILKDTVMSGNNITKGRAIIILGNSTLSTDNVTLLDNTIIEDTSAECRDAIALNLSITGLNATTENPFSVQVTDAGCRDFTPVEDENCFSGSTTVEVIDVGDVPLKDVKLGQKIRVGVNKFEPIYSFGHSDGNRLAHFLQIETINKVEHLQITADHLLFVEDRGAIPASLVTVGDKIVMADKKGTAVVESIKRITARGAFAPFTPSGKVVVNGFLASSFIALSNDNGNPETALLGGVEITHQWLAHSFEFPHRLVCHYLRSCPNETYTEEGISTWVDGPKNAGLWLLRQSDTVRIILGGVLVGVLVIFDAMEMVILNPVMLVIVIWMAYKIRRSAGKRLE